MNIHRIKNYLTLTLDDGTNFTTNECTDEVFNKIMMHVNDRDTLVSIFYPDWAHECALPNSIKDEETLLQLVKDYLNELNK